MQYKGFRLETINYDLLGGYVNSYVLETQNHIYIIDANTGGAEKLFRQILSGFSVNKKQVTLLCTHGHWDHVSLAGWLRDNYGARILAPEASKKMMSDPEFQLHALYDRFASEQPFSSQIRDLYMSEFRYPAEPNGCITDGDVFEDKYFSLKVIATPGHWGDCVSFVEENTHLVFCGDAVQGRGLDGNAPFYVDSERYVASLQRIREEMPMGLLGGHMLVMGPQTCMQMLDLSSGISREFDRYVQWIHENESPVKAAYKFSDKFGFAFGMHAVSVLFAHMKAKERRYGKRV